MIIQAVARLMLVMMLLALPAAANAYMGPGLGMGAVSVALGIVASVLLGLFSIIWYPVKRLIRSLRRSSSDKRE